MEGLSYQSAYQAPSHQPHSPPATPGSPPPALQSTTAQPVPTYRHLNIPFLEQSPPLDHIEPTGRGYSFNYTRSQPTDLSRPSSISSPDHLATEASDAGSSPEVEPHMVHDGRPDERLVWTVDDDDLEIEEVGENDIGYNSQTEVVQPDGFEEPPRSRQDRLGDDKGVSEHFERLNCDESAESSGEAQRRRYERKKKRWSSGLFKRSHSQSIGSDTDVDDVDAINAHDVGSSARRLRRRVRGPGDRSSLIFEDIGSTNVDEMGERSDGSSRVAPSLQTESDGLTALPFWVLQDPMEIDSGSSRPSSRS